MCSVWMMMYLMIVLILILILLVVSVDWYKSFSDFLNCFSCCSFMIWKSVFFICFMIWLYSFLCVLFFVMGWWMVDYFVYDKVCYFFFIWVYFILIFVLNFILLLLVMCGIYIKIYMIVFIYYKNVEGDDSWKFCFIEEKKVYFSNVSVVKMMFIFVGVFFCCWVLFFLVSIIVFICGELCMGSIFYEVCIVLLMFGYLNLVFNLFFFVFCNCSFKVIYLLMVSLLKVCFKFESKISCLMLM